jgi:Type IV secretion-system coupling protein DNA-binding domain
LLKQLLYQLRQDRLFGPLAEVMADLFGKQERIDITRSDTQQGLIGRSVSKSEQVREVHTVMPGEFQSLPPLAGYLTISDGTPAAKVKIEAQGYGKGVKRFVAIDKKAVPSVSETVITPEDAAILAAEDD